MQEYRLIVSEEDSGKRLDIFLSDFSKSENLGISRAVLQQLISSGHVKIGEDSRKKAHYRLKAGEEILLSVEEKPSRELEAEDIPLKIVYEDNDLAVIDKPSGMVVHPAPGNNSHTLVNALLFHFKELSMINPSRPGIVHRLDKETSGLLVVAKNNSAHLLLSKAFSAHDIKRQYVALVKGEVQFDEDTIELAIGRHPHKRQSMACGIGKNLRDAKTFYRTVIRRKDFSMLELEPYTGRTHQLRVHLSFLGHPILGDTKYGKNNKFSRLALHAKYLGFRHPGTNKFLEFTSPLPDVFSEFIEKNKSAHKL